MPDLLFELFSEEIPARMQARAAEDLRKHGDRPAGRCRARLRGRDGVRDAAAAGAGGAGHSGAPARPQGGEEGAAGRRSRQCGAGLPQERGPRLACRGDDPEGPEEGRLLCRADREAGARRDRRAGGDPPARHPHLPVAEVDALGRALGAAGRAALGAAAAFDRRDLRAGDRGARHRAVCDRRHRGGRRDARPPLPGAEDSG